MATRLYGLSQGENEFDVTETAGSATSADNIELTVDLAAGLKKSEVLLALDKFKDHILKDSGQNFG